MIQCCRSLRIAGYCAVGLIFSGCWGNEGGDLGGTAILAIIQAFAEVLARISRIIFGGIGVLLVLALFVWIWCRRK